jgi:GNAT superfamily N-acetyltransferase
VDSEIDIAMTVTILPYSPELAGAFDQLNRAWIAHYFVVEPFDDLVLTQPQKMILDPGGEIWFGALDDEVVGVCALMPYAPGVLEFTKLGVSEKARGHGVARALFRHSVERAHALGARTMKILTSRKLAPANGLYVSEGAIEIPLSDADRARYKRCDIIYDLPL